MKQELSAKGKEIYLSKLNLLEGDCFHMLSPWQRKFVSSVYEQFLINPILSKKQMDEIDSIFEIATEAD